MMIKRLKQDISLNLLNTAITAHLRGSRRPVSFAVAIDDDEVIAHALILSTSQARMIEDLMQKQGLMPFEMVQLEFEE